MLYRSLDLIHEEHRALAAMLSGFRTLATNIANGRIQPDFKLMAAMLRYIEEVPEKVHHPKEDQYLFAKLRQRCDEALPCITALEADHARGEERIRTVRAAMTAYEQKGAAGFRDFEAALTTYLEDEWRHMNTEEQKIFPLARAHLTAEDWAEIDAAFLANDNPWEGAAGEYAQLFSMIVNMAPAPVGLGG